MTLPRSAPALAALAASLLLSGCLSFGGKPPKALITLSPAAAPAVGETQRVGAAGTVLILVPTMPQEVATLRVPVRSSGTQLAYVKDVAWVEPPSRLFARLMADTVSAKTGRVVVSQAQFPAHAGATLSGDLRAFGVDAGTSSAIVTFDGSLDRGGGAPLEKRRFEARVPLARIDAPSVGPALNQAANDVAGQVADWVGR